MTRMLSLAVMIAFGCATTALLVTPVTAHAQSADKQAEKFRLSEEMKRLAQRNAWPGVESKYEDLLALGVELEFETHELGAQSARYLGKTLEVYERLERAKALVPTSQILQEMEAIDTGYGRVDIQGNEKWEVPLRRPSMPFEPDKRKSVEYAISVALGAGSFKGMLPTGDYIIGNEEATATLAFTVDVGPDWQELPVTKDMVSSSVGLISYQGPVAFIGGVFTSSGVPEERVEAADGRDSAQPLDISGAGLNVELGYQIGFLEIFGIAGTIEYRGTSNSVRSIHAFTGTLFGVITPGDARIAFGPTWGYIGGRGTGVAPWFDRGQDPNQFPTDEIPFGGNSLAGGLKFTVGYGVLDFEPLQGVVELEGFWLNDGVRSFAGGALRVGITPRVPRFRE